MSEDQKDRGVETKETPIRTVGVIVMHDNQILTVRHRAGTTAGEGVTGFPGGRQKEGESEEEAAIRELREETGLHAAVEDLSQFPGNFFAAKLSFKGYLQDATMRVFICSIALGELGKETLETKAEWVPISRINQGFYHTLPNVLEAINNASRFLDEKN